MVNAGKQGKMFTFYQEPVKIQDIRQTAIRIFNYVVGVV